MTNLTRTTLTVMVCSIAAAGLGCGGSDSIAPSARSADQLFWKLNLNVHAATLTVVPPFNTVQLGATPLSPLGTPLPSTAFSTAFSTPVTYKVVSNDTSLMVDSTGLVTAHSPKLNVRVIASQTIAGTTLVDTVVVNINALTNPPSAATFTMQLLAGDSAKIQPSLTKPVTARVLDALGKTITNVAVHYRSADSTKAWFASPTASTVTGGIPPSTVMLYADAYIYGQLKTDSLLITVEYPYVQAVQVYAMIPAGRSTPVSYFSPGTMTTRVGAVVVWTNISGQLVDIVFDDPSASQTVPGIVNVGSGILILSVSPSGGGNIAAFDGLPPGSVAFVAINVGGVKPDSVMRARSFPRAGTYPYHSQLYGTTGVVIVQQ